MSMDPEVRAKWTAALRSGEYEQGTGTLRDANDRYCCLGVLCDVAGMNWSAMQEEGVYMVEGCYDYPPAELIESVKLTDDRVQTLVSLNDDTRAPFTEIADYIERCGY